jgi:hypothetical protein
VAFNRARIVALSSFNIFIWDVGGVTARYVQPLWEWLAVSNTWKGQQTPCLQNSEKVCSPHNITEV